jgi:outer membrane beta-barrel protein
MWLAQLKRVCRARRNACQNKGTQVEGNTLQVTRNGADSKNESALRPSLVTHLQDQAPQQPVASAKEDSPWPQRIRIGVIVFSVIWLFLIGTLWSRAANADDNGTASSSSNANSNDEYSFKWLDPEKKIYVLQNRRYLKSGHLMLSVMGGPGFSNAYRNTFSVQPRVTYYFSEDWGFEVFYSKIFNSENNTFKALTSTGTNVFPVIHEVRSSMGALIHWVPWYAKINVFNSILYFDWYFSGGLGAVTDAMTTSTTNPNSFSTEDQLGVFVGTGHQYHLSETFTVRLDFMGTYYRAPLTVSTGEKVWFSNYDFTFGLGIRL